MKTIEEINQHNVKKILTQKKKFQILSQETLLKLVLELQKVKKREFNISKVFVLLKKVEI
jgi:hypothetical protein